MSYRVFENKASYYAAHNPPDYTHAVSLWDVWEYAWDGDLVARCPTPEAAEAARRLLSGECERELAEAQMDRLVAAKTGPGKPMRVAYVEGYDEGLVYGYANGISDGAAQERARIVAFVRKRHRGTGLADLIERGEAGE